jgi:hypothetical protein
MTQKQKIEACNQLLKGIDYSEKEKVQHFLCAALKSTLKIKSFPEFYKELERYSKKYANNLKGLLAIHVYNPNYRNAVWDGHNYNARREFVKHLIKVLSTPKKKKS